MPKKILIYGMLVKKNAARGNSRADYQDRAQMPRPGKATLMYTIEDSITPDDVLYALSKAGVRVAAVDKYGKRFQGVIGFDYDTRHMQGDKVLNRIGLNKAIAKDMKGVAWRTPQQPIKKE